MIDVGLIGFGLAGRAFHAPVIHAVPGLRLAAIVQRNGNEAATQYPEVRVVRTLVELLNIREIRSVVIATQNDSAELIALKCGHLFGRNTTYLAVKQGAYLRGFVYAFIEMVAPGWDRRRIEQALQGSAAP